MTKEFLDAADVEAATPITQGGGPAAALEMVLVTALAGLPFLFHRTTYADERVLHFGTETGYRHPRLAHLRRGTHRLATRASVVRFHHEPRTGELVTHATVGRDPDSGGFDLVIRFSSGGRVSVLPVARGVAEQCEVSDFEVLTPETFIRVGPGLRWLTSPQDREKS